VAGRAWLGVVWATESQYRARLMQHADPGRVCRPPGNRTL